MQPLPQATELTRQRDSSLLNPYLPPVQLCNLLICVSFLIEQWISLPKRVVRTSGFQNRKSNRRLVQDQRELVRGAHVMNMIGSCLYQLTDTIFLGNFYGTFHYPSKVSSMISHLTIDLHGGNVDFLGRKSFVLELIPLNIPLV